MTFIKLCWCLSCTWEQITQSSQDVNKGSVSLLFSGIVFSIVISGVMWRMKIIQLCVHRWVDTTTGVMIDLNSPHTSTSTLFLTSQFIKSGLL
jgi:hypothetical protein